MHGVLTKDRAFSVVALPTLKCSLKEDAVGTDLALVSVANENTSFFCSGKAEIKR